MTKLFFNHLSNFRPLNSSDNNVPVRCTRKATSALRHGHDERPVSTGRVLRTNAAVYLCAQCTAAVYVERVAVSVGHAPGSALQLAALVQIYLAERGCEPSNRPTPVEATMRHAMRLWVNRKMVLRIGRRDENGIMTLRYIWREACPECLLKTGHENTCTIALRQVRS